MSQQLVRSSTDKKVAGVAAGVAHHLGLDVSLVRILWILAALMGGFGVLAYIVLWIALPEGPTESASASAGGAIAVAEERYARGEIGADELATIKRNLQS
jgi:phage shock protein PspC (stress-responsive transcriptional regulator)